MLNNKRKYFVIHIYFSKFYFLREMHVFFKYKFIILLFNKFDFLNDRLLNI